MLASRWQLLVKAGRAFTIAGVALLGLGFALITIPEHYEAVGRIKADTWPGSDNIMEWDHDLAFRSRLIRSSAILFHVITNLNLCQKLQEPSVAPLSVDAVYARLKKCISVQPARGTGLLEIRVRDADPVQASLIANEIAGVYRSFMMRQWEYKAVASIETLEAVFRQMEDRVKDAQALVERLGKELNLPTNAVAPVTFRGESRDKPDVTDYWKARGALDVLTKIRDELWMRLIQEKVDAELPRCGGIVEIIDPAEPPIRPSSRWKTLAMVAFVAGIASLGAGAACTLFARARLRA